MFFCLFVFLLEDWNLQWCMDIITAFLAPHRYHVNNKRYEKNYFILLCNFDLRDFLSSKQWLFVMTLGKYWAFLISLESGWWACLSCFIMLRGGSGDLLAVEASGLAPYSHCAGAGLIQTHVIPDIPEFLLHCLHTDHMRNNQYQMYKRLKSFKTFVKFTLAVVLLQWTVSFLFCNETQYILTTFNAYISLIL